MSNTPTIGKHSMAIVHRVVKRRHNGNTKKLPTLHGRERWMHPTKGLRSHATRNFAVMLKAVRA